MAKQDYPFPDDEFDLAGPDRSPQGVHRTPRPRWRTLLPFIVVILLAPALAYVGVSYLAGQGNQDGTGSGVTAAPTDQPEVTPTPTVTQTPAEAEAEPVAEPTPEPTPEEPGIPRDVRVVVLNGTTRSGLAGSAAARLQEDGFTSTTLGNANSRVPTRSTVYYNNAALAESAQQVATVLGIGPIMELSSATTSIAVVLRSDYAG